MSRVKVVNGVLNGLLIGKTRHGATRPDCGILRASFTVYLHI